MVGLIGFVAPKIYYYQEPVPILPITHIALAESVPVKIPVKVKTNYVQAPIVVTPETKEYIDKIFGEDAAVATAVLKHESGLNLKAKNWNCHYYKTITNKDGVEEQKRYSTSCKPDDRENAWSVDCGIAQINVKGKVCPDHLLTLSGNMEQVEKKYKEQGLRAWASYNNGRYKKFLST